MPTINISVSVPKNIGDYSEQLSRLRTRKQIAMIGAIKKNQRADKLSEDVQIRFGSRRINVRKSSDTSRLVRQFGQKVFGQKWTAIGTSQPPLDEVVNDIMGNIYALAPRWPGEKTRTARYRESFQLYHRQSGEKELKPTIYPIGEEGWDTDTMFVIANLISYASSLEAQIFEERGRGIMYHAAQMASRKYPFVGVRFRYYREDRLPSGDYGAANADLRQIRYYSIPVIEVGRASLVRKPSRRPGINSRSSQSSMNRRRRSVARRNLRRARRR